MKKKILIIVSIVAIILIGLGIFYICSKNLINNKTNQKNEISQVSQTDEAKDDVDKNIVVIENNKIKNENLIDEFIENTTIENTKSEPQKLEIKQDDMLIEVKYTPGEYFKNKNENEENTTINIGDGTKESDKKLYGFYSLIINDELKGEYSLINHTIERIISDNNVILCFYSELIDYLSYPQICTYSLDSSNYTKKFDLLYEQRKDLGIKNIYDAGEYSIKTFGGDVTITIDGDMVYSLEDALNKKVISPEDIINQVELDEKYGICEKAYYTDGGSKEYKYYEEPQYTILKLNTIDGDKDLIIGMGGQIIVLYNKNK